MLKRDYHFFFDLETTVFYFYGFSIISDLNLLYMNNVENLSFFVDYI